MKFILTIIIRSLNFKQHKIAAYGTFAVKKEFTNYRTKIFHDSANNLELVLIRRVPFLGILTQQWWWSGH